MSSSPHYHKPGRLATMFHHLVMSRNGGSYIHAKGLIHSFKCLLGVYHVLRTVLGPGGSAVSKTDGNPYHQGAYILAEGAQQK